MNPNIRDNGKFLVIEDVVMGLEQGLHIRPAAAFVKLSNEYKPLTAFFEDQANPGDLMPTDSIMRLLELGAAAEAILNIYVTKGPGAEDFARVLYSGLISSSPMPEPYCFVE
jgi:phosphotransferase system HPr-like phosphotransfer protein